jgi:hypothetical protein
MSTELKGVTAKTGEVSMTRFWGGEPNGVSVQMTFKKPEEERNRSDFGYWYLQMNKKQALEMAAALIEFANDTREEVYLAD